MAGQFAEFPVPGTSTTINGLTGSVNILAGSGISISTVSPNITITNSLVSGSQSANTVYSGPASGGAAAPTFRALVSADIPSLSALYLPLSGGTLSGDVHFSNINSQIFLGGALATDSFFANTSGTGGLNIGGEPVNGGPEIALNGPSGNGGYLYVGGSNGTATSPTASTNGNNLFTIAIYGFGSANWQQGPLIQATSIGTWTDSVHTSTLNILNNGITKITQNGNNAFNLDANGRIGVGNVTPAANTLFTIQASSALLTGGGQYNGLVLNQTFPSTATAGAVGVSSTPLSQATAFTMTFLAAFNAGVTKGAGSTITRAVNYLGSQAVPGTNNAIFADNIAFTGNYVINSTSTNPSLISGDLQIATAGKGLQVKSGSNARVGTGTLSGGTVVVSNTSVTASTLIFLTDTGGGVLANIGSLYVSAVSAGTSFTVSSSNVLDSSNFNYMLVESI